MVGWPAYDVLRETDGLGPHLLREIPGGKIFRNLPPTQSRTREVGGDLLSVAFEFAGAATARQHEFATMGENGELGWPFGDSHSQVWKLPERRVQREGSQGLKFGMRMGRGARGESSNYAQCVTSTHPALRSTRARELRNFLHSNGLIGFPPAMNADASLGLACMEYQSAIVATSTCEAGEFALIHFVGATSRAHTTPRQDFAQRAKVGYLPCRAQATHVAISPSRVAGRSIG